MLDRTVRIGMIGCGHQANVHFGALHALGEEIAIVVAVCDLDDERLAKAGEVWPKARRTTDYRRMLEPADLDLVIVATMPNTHEAMSLASLDAGAHVLCEKPFMLNVEQAENVLAKAADTGFQIQLGTNMRYMPSSQYLHDLVRGGSIGEPVFGKVWGCHDIPPVWAPHYHLATSGGGVLASVLSHPMDTIKTCMQGDIHGENYGSIVQTGSKLYKEGGVGAFYRGVGWRTSRLICLVFIINAIKEPVAKVMYPHHFA